MKRKQYRSKTILCPFYKKEESQVIYCEGVEDGTSTHLAFGNASACAKYKCEKCRTTYQMCRIYQMLAEGFCDD